MKSIKSLKIIRPPKITFVISSLSAGGAERVVSIMANYWVEKKWAVTIITLDDKGKDFYDLNSSISRVSLCLLKDSSNIWESVFNNIKRIIKLNLEIKKTTPDIVISFMGKTNILTLLSQLGNSVPVIISERSDPTKINDSLITKMLRFFLYKRADYLVVQSESIYKWATKFLKTEIVKIIPNPIKEVKVIKKVESKEPCNIVALGRLSDEKGFDILIQAFSKIEKDYPQWNLIIYGEGKRREYLEKLIINYGLESRIKLPGLVKNPIEMLNQADIYVLSSRREGFPNALLEAMSVGLPAISTKCTGGISEIVEHKKNGLLIEPDNVSQLCESLSLLMSNKDLRAKLGKEAKEVNKRFSLKTIMNIWEEIIFSKFTRSDKDNEYR